MCLFYFIWYLCVTHLFESLTQQRDYWNGSCVLITVCIVCFTARVLLVFCLCEFLPMKSNSNPSLWGFLFGQDAAFEGSCMLVCKVEREIPHRNRLYVFENKSLVDNSLTFTSVRQQM